MPIHAGMSNGAVEEENVSFFNTRSTHLEVAEW